MKAIDRLRVIKRAALTALNPKLEVLNIVYVDKTGKLFSRYIHSDSEWAKKLFVRNLHHMFVDRAKDSDGLQIMLINFVDAIQTEWNEKHPDDQMDVIKRTDEDNEQKAD